MRSMDLQLAQRLVLRLFADSCSSLEPVPQLCCSGQAQPSCSGWAMSWVSAWFEAAPYSWYAVVASCSFVYVVLEHYSDSVVLVGPVSAY